MTATKTTKPAQDGTSAAYTFGMASESVASDFAQATYILEPVGETIVSPMQQSGGSVTSLSSSAITNPASTLTRPANATPYAANSLIASNPLVVPSFNIATSGGGAILSRLRLKSNVTTGWGGVNLCINLWAGAAPTYTNGDGGAYAVSAGAGLWLGNFVVPMLQFADSAWGAGQLTGANELALRLASGTAVFWDIQILTAATPISGQAFILIPELLN
jgi:hypothetical protein